MHAGHVVLTHTVTLLQGQLSPHTLRVHSCSDPLCVSLSVVNKSVSFLSWHVNRPNLSRWISHTCPKLCVLTSKQTVPARLAVYIRA